jgi:hypothetical protein
MLLHVEVDHDAFITIINFQLRPHQHAWMVGWLDGWINPGSQGKAYSTSSTC